MRWLHRAAGKSRGSRAAFTRPLGGKEVVSRYLSVGYDFRCQPGPGSKLRDPDNRREGHCRSRSALVLENSRRSSVSATTVLVATRPACFDDGQPTRVFAYHATPSRLAGDNSQDESANNLRKFQDKLRWAISDVSTFFSHGDTPFQNVKVSSAPAPGAVHTAARTAARERTGENLVSDTLPPQSP